MAKIGRPSCREAVLNGLPGTIVQVARRGEVSPSSASKWLEILGKERVVYVSRWIKRGNNQVPFYRLRVKQSSVDAPKPAPLSGSEYQRRYNERNPGRRAEIHKAYEDRQKLVAANRKKALKAWALPLTVVISESH